METVELQLRVPLEPGRVDAVDGVGTGVGGDALDLGEGGVEVFQHLDELLGGHEQAVAVLEKHRAHAALDPVVGHGQGLVVPVVPGLAGGLLALDHVHPKADQVNVLFHVLRPADAEGDVPVKAAKTALVPAAAPVDAQEQAVGLAGGADGPQLEAAVLVLLQGRVLL